MVTIPRLVLAAPASGSGKTTVACGLMAAFRARGLVVSGHKVGPDYIDPSYHAIATGRPARNLDPVLCGEELVAPLFAHGAAGAQVAVVEGVMGYFDGLSERGVVSRSSPDFGSTAHVARLLRAPVILVLDASKAGRSVAALVAGFAAFDPHSPLAGLILNRVGSERHERLLRDALAPLGLPVFGAIRRTDRIVTPSRHLGLIPAAERHTSAAATIAHLAALVAQSCDLAALLALARHSPPLPGPAWDPAPPRVGPPDGRRAVRVAVAGGAAFTFGYTEQVELLEAAGAEVTRVDPLRDEDLPDGTDGLIIGGGFPEVHAAELSANERLRARVAALAASGAPVAAECAGLLYLARSLDRRPMCGVLDVDATMTPSLTLGYRRARALTDSPVAQAGDVVRGHEFHRTAAASGSQPAWCLEPGGPEGHVKGSVVASYLHTHWAGHPAAAARFVAACAS
ncbi:MAG TPA: cobyrinate a,c-diamide synthase [Streptosporangiaceae bacterium]|nr:cobyrinate a,c-diamide synthase [Streptosporangiaceae bacterium]